MWFKYLLNLLKIVAWVGVWLLLIEISIYWLVPYNPPPQQPNNLQAYLEYGRSVEGKIRQMVGDTDDTTIPITQVGWLDPQRTDAGKPTQASAPTQTLIAVYGMSFARRLSRHLPKLSPQVEIRFLGGPGASPNHSYALYEFDRSRQHADVVAWGILASAVVGMTTMTSLNKAFEYPAPYTYPKYRWIDGQLEVTQPPVVSLAGFRATLEDDMKWAEYVAYLQREDSYFQPVLFYENPSDWLATTRFFRRSLAKRYSDRVLTQIYNPSSGFLTDSPEVQALKVLVVNFAQQVRADGKIPLLLLFNNLGYSDHLYQLLAETITAEQILTMSSHAIAPADNRQHFIADGHFKPAMDRLMAQEVLTLLEL